MEDFLHRDEVAYCENVSLEHLAEIFGTPLYVYSQSTLERTCRELKNAFASHPTLPCFAVKANGNLSVLKEIFAQGFGADIVSVGELERALLAGAKPSEIVYSGVGKRPEEIARALDVGILSFNVESIGELQLIGRIAAQKGTVAPISVRINPNINVKTHPHIATGLYSTKFGIPESDLTEVANEVRKNSSLEWVGLDCHIGSQIVEIEPFQQAAQRLSTKAVELKKEGFSLKCLNLGGGVGIQYLEEKPFLFKDYAECILKEISPTGMRLVLEPGRCIVGNAGILLTRVLGIKRNAEKTFVIVDAAMTELIRPSLYEAYHGIELVRPRSKKAEAVDIVGPVCETGDFLARDRQMELPHVGDLLFVRSAGAYGASMGSRYNARPLAAEVLVQKSASRLVRRREQLSDIWALELDGLRGM